MSLLDLAQDRRRIGSSLSTVVTGWSSGTRSAAARITFCASVHGSADMGGSRPFMPR